ncbi:MAG: hypothetical protein Q8R20_02595 [Nanoarchaeota archaeon]|nr:hypothetical protein [Nanoarchaeota archaeon]
MVIHRRRCGWRGKWYTFFMKGYKKYVLGFLGIFFLVLMVLFAAPKISWWYGGWKDAQFQKKVEQVRKEDYDRAMSDTYGGKTPQETLKMYIEAVEKGDYELASRYFVEKEREKELARFEKSLKENLDNMIATLKRISFSSGSFSESKDVYIAHDPVFVKFILYPNGIWKIVEI